MSSTREQQDVIDKILASTSGIPIPVKARSGTGKTRTAVEAVHELHKINLSNILYTSFNRAIILDGSKSFPKYVECRTLHALALSNIHIPSKRKLQSSLSYSCITERLSYKVKREIIDAIARYYRSGSTSLDEYMNEILRADKAKIAIKYIDLMIADKIDPTFDYILKMFHLSLNQKLIQVEYDLIIFDEFQDLTGVSFEIFRLMKAKKKLAIGDDLQSIYAFMRLVNGFEKLDGIEIMEFTKSFRCSVDIAKKVESFCKKEIDPKFKFNGTETPTEDGKTAYITATNANIIRRINELHSDGIGYSLTRELKDIFACTIAIANASAGREIYNRNYKFLNDEFTKYRNLNLSKSFYSYLKEFVDDEEVSASVDLMISFQKKDINIFSVMKEAERHPIDENVLVATAFSIKGLGFSTVYIEEDLNKKVETVIRKEVYERDQNDRVVLMLYYVAVTRCRKHLYGARLL